MSFRTTPRMLDRSFDVVRQSLSQRPGLPFSDVLTAADMQQVGCVKSSERTASVYGENGGAFRRLHAPFTTTILLAHPGPFQRDPAE